MSNAIFEVAYHNGYRVMQRFTRASRFKPEGQCSAKELPKLRNTIFANDGRRLLSSLLADLPNDSHRTHALTA